MNLKNIILVIVLIFSIAPVSYSNSQEQKKNTVAIVDLQMVLERSIAAQAIRNKIEEISKNVQKRVEAKESDLKKLEEELLKKRVNMSERDFEYELLKFNKSATQLKREAQESKGKIEQAYSEAINKVHEEILKIINNLSYENGYVVVIPASVVIYYSPKTNMTETIIERLNGGLKEVKVNY
jgi:Skp family chaperone for outer membrane proteins